MRRNRPSGMAAVLFTDLVGSTELMTRLGAASFDDLRRAHFAALARAIELAGGAEVKNTGDGVMVTFGSVVDAIECAVAMQRATERQARTAEPSLAIRVGLSVGEVTFEGDDVFGAPVVEAARLVAAAGCGQILTTVIARALAAGRISADYVELGLLELKGLPQPVAVCEVHWDPLPEPALPMPALLTDVGAIFVGRDAEVERLHQLWMAAVSGERRVALVAGEPGVGKTRLAAEVARAAHAEGATVLAGRCDEDLGVPYQPFVEALRHFVDHVPDSDLAERVGREGRELALLVPELAARLAELPAPLKSDPETERYRLFDAVAVWLTALSEDEPVLLVLDDLQWAAKPTLLLLRHLIRSPDSARLLILGTYRDSDVGHGHPLAELLADVRRQDDVERFCLLGLDSAGVTRCLAEAVGHALDDDDLGLARAVYEETQGNPFFVREVLRHLAETGALSGNDRPAGARSAIERLAIPDGVREVVGRRLARLSRDANQVLRVAAVAGTDFEFSVVRAVADVEEEVLLVALEEAIRARLVIEVGGARHRFAHALVRDTIYGDLAGARRLTLHQRVASAIEDLYAGRLDEHLPALAHHYVRASSLPGVVDKAFEYAVRAGEWARTVFAHDESVGYYRQALGLVDGVGPGVDDQRRQTVLICLGEAERRAGDAAYRETLLEAARLARKRGDADGLARAALANQRGTLMSSFGAVDEDRVAILRSALAMVGAPDSAVAARLLARLALELAYGGDAQARERFSGRALAMARRLGDRRTTAEVLTARAAIVTPYSLQDRLSETAELLGLADDLEDQLLLSQVLHLRIRSAMEAGEVQDADRCLTRLVELASELRQPTLQWIATYTRAGRVLFAGQVDDAERLAGRARELCEDTGQPDTNAFFDLQLFGVRFEQGRLGEVEHRWRQESETHVPRHPLGRALLTLLLCELDRRAEARIQFDRVASTGFAEFPVDNYWLLAMASSAAVANQLADETQCEILLGHLTPFAGHLAGVRLFWFGAISHYLGLLHTTLRRFDEAEACFAAAESTHDRIGAPTWLARTRLEWAGMLLARQQPGEDGRASDLLRQALTTSREIGLGSVERRAVALSAQAASFSANE